MMTDRDWLIEILTFSSSEISTDDKVIELFDKLQSKIEELEKYARHDPLCEIYPASKYHAVGKCSCGFDELTQQDDD